MCTCFDDAQHINESDCDVSRTLTPTGQISSALFVRLLTRQAVLETLKQVFLPPIFYRLKDNLIKTLFIKFNHPTLH